MVTKQTAGRDNLGEFAPQFAALNDDVLFGEVWSKESELSRHDRSMITCSALMAAPPLTITSLFTSNRRLTTALRLFQLVTTWFRRT